MNQLDAIRDAGRKAARYRRLGDEASANYLRLWAERAARLDDSGYGPAMREFDLAYRAEAQSYDVPRGYSGSGKW